MNKYEWRQAFIEAVHGGGETTRPGTPPIVLHQYHPLLPPEPYPSVPEDDLRGPGWTQSYSVPANWVFPVDDG